MSIIMPINFLSFFLTEEDGLLAFNSDLLETNLFNILLLLGLLVYGYKVSFVKTLEKRQQDIVLTIENAQQDLVNASNYYSFAEKGFTQSLFWLQLWKTFYKNEKKEFIESKYKQVKTGLLENFSTTENLIENFEKKAFLSLQKYIIFLTASRILRKFLFLSETEQSQLIEVTIVKLRGKSK